MKENTKEAYKTGGTAAGFFMGMVLLLFVCIAGFFGGYDWLNSFAIFSGQRLDLLCIGIAGAIGGAFLVLIALKIAVDIRRPSTE
jgi:hypothetical protein